MEVLEGTYPKLSKTFVTMACFHCKDPACVKACPTGACHKEPGHGIVMIDQNVCIGCRRCVAACPYGAPQYNFTTGKTEKCTFCYTRIIDQDGNLIPGMAPACVTSCTGRALTFGEDSGDFGDVPPNFANPALTKPAVTFTK